MKVQLNNAKDLLKLIINEQIVFADDSARTLINALGKYYSKESNKELTDFMGTCYAADIADELQEILLFNGWEVDWFDVLSAQVDSHELACSAYDTTNLRNHWRFEDVEEHTTEFINDWTRNASLFLKNAIANE